MSSVEDEDEFDAGQFEEVKKFMEMKKTQPASKFQVSGWDDDTDGIEEEKEPHKNPQTEILWGAENGELDLVKNLVSVDKTLLQVKDKDGYTPLHRACYNDHYEVAAFLLSAGADYKATTEDLWQPLHSACRWNNALCAAKLLDCGADINAESRGGQTPLHLAASSGSAKETLELLLLNKNLKSEIRNDSNETAYDIAKRSGKYHKLFEIMEPCINKL